jgi:GT2 family glycosyltransferase
MNTQKSPEVFVVILNYNGLDTIDACLKSVFKNTYPNFQVVVVDNNSSDGSFEFIRSHFDRAHLIRNDHNAGFAAGVNLGIRFALEKTADYIFLLNPDAKIQPKTIASLVQIAEKDLKNGIISPLITRENSSELWFSGGEIDWWKMAAFHSRPSLLKSNFFSTTYVSGCAMLIRKEVFKKIGLFDEDYFLYYEDADFCWRAGRQGFQSMVMAEPLIEHQEKSADNPVRKTFWLVLSGLIFFHKNSPLPLRIWHRLYLPLRKIKNWLELRKRATPKNQEVARAYKEFSLWNKKMKSDLS